VNPCGCYAWFEGDAVAEGLELGDRPLPLAIGVVPDEVAPTNVLVAAVVGEQARIQQDHAGQLQGHRHRGGRAADGGRAELVEARVT
jgi:hypothetical protein